MDWQMLIATLLVLACASYSLWSVLPAPWRRRIDAWRGHAAPVADAGGGGCGGCSGCSDARSPAAAGPRREAVIRIVRAPP